jgi:ABC-type multidrug transport system ATPase subunit
MVALGRALLANPKLLLCDEISLGLAPIVVGELYAQIPRVRERGVGIVVVEQDISRSLDIADRFCCPLEGRVVLSAHPGEVGRDTVVQHYFGLWEPGSKRYSVYQQLIRHPRAVHAGDDIRLPGARRERSGRLAEHAVKRHVVRNTIRGLLPCAR